MRATRIVIRTRTTSICTGEGASNFLLWRPLRAVYAKQSRKISPSRELSTLQKDCFEYIGRIFSLVGSHFQNLVKFLELNELDRILFRLKQSGDRPAADMVGLVFEAVDLFAMFHDGAVLFQ